MASGKIVIKGAREHNLKGIDLVLPRDSLIVMTGISGSGKSSLAFDTIYAEGQRRYVESLSSYARQFLGQMEKPDVESIEGLSPAIAIDQKTTSRNPRSTVGTVTEIYDYLRLLYARIGVPHCPDCGVEISRSSAQGIVDRVAAMEPGTRFTVLAPVVRGRKGEYRELLDELASSGFVRAFVDGQVRELADEILLDKKKKHDIEVVVDRLVMKDGIAGRLNDSVETALKLSGGLVVVEREGGGRELFSESLACTSCGRSLPELQPRIFSFNNPFGACPECTGLGFRKEIDPDLVVPDRTKTLRQGALIPWAGAGMTYYPQLLQAVADKYEFSIDAPWNELSEEAKDVVLYGSRGEKLYITFDNRRGGKRRWFASFEGVVPSLQRRYRESQSEYSRAKIEMFMADRPCPSCAGRRLKPESLAVLVGGVDISSFSAQSVKEALAFLRGLKLSRRDSLIGARIIKEVRERLNFLNDVGLTYLTLDRSAGSLAGGEAQRIHLATQIGAGLVGVLYILDEPSIGLHQRDNRKLIETLIRLRDLGNTLIVVEHDEETIRTADHIVDIGPGAGIHGGHIVAAGTLKQIEKAKDSLTGRYMAGERFIEVPAERRKPKGELLLRGASEHNLRVIDVVFPLGVFTCVTGVSGSGKSTLVHDILYKRMMNAIYRTRVVPGKHEALLGLEQIDKVIEIDQSPIGRTPRSNPATYTGLFDHIRELFTRTEDARARGYKPGRFSFNVKGGRCENCRGDGTIKIEMHFLPDVYVPCEVCKGKRYNRETLKVKYRDKDISEVLDMTVEEGLHFFENIPRIRNKLKTINEVGLGYVKLGQSATTLSGGEAQRVKLATELSKRSTGRTVYLLDEPTTGLHFYDIEKLLGVLQRLVDAGNTVIVIEHNLDVVKSADHVIDLGPEGGDGGGLVVASGTPEEVARSRRSHTGKYLKPVLNGG